MSATATTALPRAERLLRGAILIRAALLVLAVAFVYAPSIHGGWIWDDPLEVTQNPVLREHGGLAKIWIAPAGTDYFPVKSTVQLVAWRLWHEDTLGYHLLNAVLHLTSAFLFWRLLGALGAGDFGAWAGALLFAVHPQAVESVAWISELKNTLSLPLLLLAMLAFLRFDETVGQAPMFGIQSVDESGVRSKDVRSKGSGRPLLNPAAGFNNGRPDPFYGVGQSDSKHRGLTPYVAALMIFILAMLAKSTVVMFPAVILLHAAWKRGRVGRGDLVASAPFFAVALALGSVTVWFQHARAIGGVPLHAGGIFARLAGAGLAAAFYLFKAVVPLGLLPVYPRWNVDPPSLPQFLPWIGLAALLFALWSRRTAPARAVLFGLGFFLVNLIPVLGVIPLAYMRISWVADHFAYISLLGIAGLAGAGFGAWQARAGPVAVAVLCVLAAALAVGAHRYDAIFRDNRSLWTYELERNPLSWTAHNNLGEALFLEGKKAEAGAHFREAAELEPDDPQARFNLGLVLADEGRTAEAIGEFRLALSLKPAFPEAGNSLGNALLRAGRTAEAIDCYRGALALDPDYPEAHCNLGIALSGSGRGVEAAEEFGRALALRPDYPEAHLGLGRALADLGRIPEAIGQYQRALALRPGYAPAQYEIGNALAASGRLADAVACYEEALRLDPSLAEAHNNLAVALVGLGRLGEAETHLEAALRLKPDYPDAHANLEKLRERRGEPGAAGPP